jgi:hypothetical protein
MFKTAILKNTIKVFSVAKVFLICIFSPTNSFKFSKNFTLHICSAMLEEFD